MFGRLFFFLIGAYAGVVANQRYRMPEAPTPSEAWERAKSRMEEHRRSHPCHKRPLDSGFYDDPQVQEIIQKMKDLENRYWKQKPADEDN